MPVPRKPLVTRPEQPSGLLNRYSYIYMVGSSSRRALYTGVTANLNKRVYEHKNDLVEGFSRKYKCHRLVYFETFEHISDAIAREKEIKGWRREKKNALVELINPGWKDLSEDWFQVRVPTGQKGSSGPDP